MKTVFITIILSLTLCGKIIADVVTPDILAICKVTLKNDKTIEGIILLAKGGWGNYRQNGFCYILENGTKQLILYDLSFTHFSPGDSYSPYPRKLFYVENITSQTFPETSINLDASKKNITRKTIEKEEFKLCEEMVIYKTLPLDLELNSSYSDTISIKVSEIKEVELLSTPKLRWIEIISTSKEKLNKKIEADIKEDEGAWPDFVEPVWYHEVIINFEMMKYLLGFF